MNIWLSSSIIIIGVSLIVCGSMYCSSGFSPSVGIFFLVIGSILILIPFFVYMYHRMKRSAYDDWLMEQGFITTKCIGGLKVIGNNNRYGFVIDTVNKKWSQVLQPMIFGYENIVNVDIFKDERSTTSTVSSTSSKVKMHKGIISPHAHVSSFGVSDATTRDTSRYEVHIELNDIACPLIVIPCGCSYITAKDIVHTLELATEKTFIE